MHALPPFECHRGPYVTTLSCSQRDQQMKSPSVVSRGDDDVAMKSPQGVRVHLARPTTRGKVCSHFFFFFFKVCQSKVHVGRGGRGWAGTPLA